MSLGGSDTRVVAGHVYGLRIWHLAAGGGDFRLTSAAARYQWDFLDPGPAKCQKASHHAPSPECTCGYYCFHRSIGSIRKVLMATRRPAPRVSIAGVVRVWGRTEVHATGMRSEFAAPDAFFLPAGASGTFEMVVNDLAAKYGAEVWAGDAPELLERMAETRPGLNSAITDFGQDELMLSRSRARWNRGAAQTRAKLRRDGGGGGGPVGPHEGPDG